MDLNAALKSGGLGGIYYGSNNGLTPLNSPSVPSFSVDTSRGLNLPQAQQSGGLSIPSVLGASTSNVPTTTRQAAPASNANPHINPATGQWDDNYFAQQNKANNYDQIKSDIGSGFDQYIKGLDQQLQLLPQHYQALQDNINALYGGQASTINTQGAQQNAQLNTADQTVDLNQGKTLRDLGTSFQQALDAANSKLGTLGASDSSATPMFSYAIAKQANQNRGNVLQQATQMHNDINLKRTQVQSTLNDQMNQLDTWKNSQLSSLAQWLDDTKSKFINQEGVAAQQKSQAIAAVDQSALGRLQQLDDQYTQYKQGLQQWALQHQSQLESMLAYTGQLAGYTPPPFETQAINTGLQGAASQSPTDLFGYNPFSTQKTDQFGNPIQ